MITHVNIIVLTTVWVSIHVCDTFFFNESISYKNMHSGQGHCAIYIYILKRRYTGASG